MTLPGAAPPRGRLHPVTPRRARDARSSSAGLGYSVEEGPEVETDWNNFGALNFPDDHPARDTQDTIFVEGGHVLRTHTSNVQIRAHDGPHAAVPLHRDRAASTATTSTPRTTRCSTRSRASASDEA